ncbi:uncharacterized protein HMPREF1541_00266 [Cyphellophora europaea CBS 101466]|uniref:GST C-terminal domain-containing protein n=1 Tax=Cyphellophora europaea (strain CBS 101466) TaxID=1220924 RepID=W2SBJ9_CYPE1|nr:uncharacterized protein HMPREF1541_00266 [Cyphellophora europaea CBS 101466]ETN46082.1 hypothetical protein HMPREF1541_00266 [Cyphellophora europaea CBS 101466]
MFTESADGPDNSMIKHFSKECLQAALRHLDDRLAANKWLAAGEFTLADILTVFIITTQRYFGPQVSLKGFGNLLRWLGDCTARLAYQRVMQKGDLVLDRPDAPEVSLLAAGGTKSSQWKN